MTTDLRNRELETAKPRAHPDEARLPYKYRYEVSCPKCGHCWPQSVMIRELWPGSSLAETAEFNVPQWKRVGHCGACKAANSAKDHREAAERMEAIAIERRAAQNRAAAKRRAREAAESAKRKARLQQEIDEITWGKK